MENQAAGAGKSAAPEEFQTRMFTLRMTSSQYDQLVVQATQARDTSGLSCNTYILERLGLISRDQAIELSRRLGRRGRKMSHPSPSDSGVQSCDSAM